MKAEVKLDIQVRKRILDAIKQDRKNYSSNGKHATAIGLDTSVYGYIESDTTEGKISDAKLITVARRLGINIRRDTPWMAAETSVYVYITQQLELCQQSSLSGLLCDVPNIGKTFTARQYVRTHPNAIYVDCGQVKTKMRMIRCIAKEFGISGNGRYADVYDDLVYYLKSIECPLIILDEAGDMNPETFLELKALWNATDRACGWYMMGANGLKAKIQRNRNSDTLGYEEMFSRYGDNYNRVTPQDEKERITFLKAQAMMVAQVNAPKGTDLKKIVNLSGGALRRVYTEIEKLNMEV